MSLMGGPGGKGGHNRDRGPGSMGGRGRDGGPGSMGSRSRDGGPGSMGSRGRDGGPGSMGSRGRDGGMGSRGSFRGNDGPRRPDSGMNHRPEPDMGRPGMGNSMGRPDMRRPSEPPRRRKSGVGSAILGTLLGTGLSSLTGENAETVSYEDNADTAETCSYDTAQDTGAAVETEDYSSLEDYPAVCPQCGAPTSGGKKCEYCDSTLI